MENRKYERIDCSFIFQALNTRIVLKLWVFKYTRRSDLLGYALGRSSFPNLVARVFRCPTPGGAGDERLQPVVWQQHNGLEV